MENQRSPYVLWFEETDKSHLEKVGGKNASLGEMIKNLSGLGVKVPDGFAITAEAYRIYLKSNNFIHFIADTLEKYRNQNISLQEAGHAIRTKIRSGTFPIPLAQNIREAYQKLCDKYNTADLAVAVRSSATAEDLPSASFAGLQDTYLNVRGVEQLLQHCKECFSSLFTDRAISYREEKEFDHKKVALSVGVQKMISADDAGSGVMFTIDTETGFPNVIIINANWGLGESIVQGTVNPDQYLVFKPLLEKEDKLPVLEKKLGSKEQKIVFSSDSSDRTVNMPTTPEEQNEFVLTDKEIIELSRWGKVIEDHYGSPMDIEWVKEDKTGELYIVQARPETVHSHKGDAVLKTYTLTEKGHEPAIIGLSIGSAIVHGKVCRVSHISDLKSLEEGCILVTEMTEPDWVPVMKNVAGIITDFGGRTCHAAIVSRELGIPAIVGTGNATSILRDGKKVTLSCGEGDEGVVYDGYLDYQIEEVDLDKLPEVSTEVMLNLASPEMAFKWWQLPTDGIGLARMEFIINNHIKIHPMALVHFDKILKESERESIRKLTRRYKNKKEFFIEKLSGGIAKIAASCYPKPAIVRTSDFKTNEYADLIGGEEFEPFEENPMLGWRGASRYYSEGCREGFALECRAIKRVREDMGLDNVIVMIPFCRTVGEAERVLKEMEQNDLRRGEHDLKVYMMCEIPSNIILAEEFARYFDGFSIGSNDLTQLILGVDRDSSEMAYLFDEEDPAVKEAVRDVIQKANKAGVRVGFCGQAPSDNPEYAGFLVQCGIDSISVNPDSVIEVLRHIDEAESRVKDTGILK